MLFLADQALHMTFALVGWLVILQGQPLTAVWVDVVDLVLRSLDRTTAHAIILTGIVLASVFVVNTRGAYYFLLALASPRDLRTAPDGTPAPAPVPNAVPSGASFCLEATISAMERLLMVAFVLLGQVPGVVAILAMRVAARWRQLGDRGYVEYFLLATLASLSVAVASALLAGIALASLA